MTRQPVGPTGRYRFLWAKSATEGPGHSLLGHLLDVGLAAERLLGDIRAVRALHAFAGDLGLGFEDAKRLVLILIALHDLGKAIPPFQAKWAPGAPEEAFVRVVADIPHGRAGAILLNVWLRELGTSRKVARALAHAVGVHHGVLFDAGFDKEMSYDPRSLGEEPGPWPRWRTQLCDDVIAAFGPMPLVDGQRAYPRAKSWAWLAGLTTVADWIGSGLPHRPPVDEVQTYLRDRRRDLDAYWKEIGWPEDSDWWQAPGRPEQIASWFSTQDRPFSPRALQRAMQEALGEVAEADQSTLWIVEAPMGEGKTEAAFFSMVRSGQARGAYIALPTQATSDALHARLEAFVRRHQRRPVEIALAHGGARFRPAHGGPTDRQGPVSVENGDRDVPTDAEGEEAEAVRSLWFSSGRRELLAELGVGTGDQALLSVLPARHHFVRLLALGGKTVVFDEVHAYEAYTEGLIVELVRWLAAMRSTVVLMSATLPEETRQKLAAAYQEGAGLPIGELPAATYPRVTSVGPKGIHVREFEGERPQSIALRPVSHSVDELGPLLLDLVGRGGAVGAVVNQVARAQALYAWCSDKGADVLLLHGRFPLAQRKEREAELLRRFGARSEGERRGLVIATQVVEQSLDVDFDVLVSDLAPVDLLLQRAGRLHRHDREARGGHGAPVLYVAGLGSSLADGPEAEALATVYHPHLLWRSWAILAEAKTIELPQDIDAWVQHVYGQGEMQPLAPFTQQVEAEAHAYEVRRQTAVLSALQWTVAKPFDAAIEAWTFGASDDEERKPGLVRAPTRLGEPSVTVVPVIRRGRRWHLPSEDGSVAIDGGQGAATWALRAIGHQMRVGRKSLLQKLLSAPRPAWWVKQKSLRFMVPLELTEEGRATVDSGVLLDPELGLVYPEPRVRERSHA